MFNYMETITMTTLTKGMRSAQQWRERIDQQVASGKSVAAFCKEQGIAAPTFYWWRTRLARQLAGAVTKVAAKVPFLDLGAMSDAAPASGSLSIRVDLPGGITLTIARS